MLYDYIIEKIVNNQDFKQRFYMVIIVSLELYRMLVSTLLILFVPHNCNDNLCSINENLIWQNPLYDVGLIFNFITLFAFIMLYGIEIVRENRMITYLEVNPENPLDNKSLSSIFENLPQTYREQIYSIDSIYQKISYICNLFFIVNTIISGIIVYEYDYGNQTTTTFITNVLFMTNKIYYRYYITNTDKSIFYSAYIRDFVQYNDIDPKIKVDIERGVFHNRELTTPQHYLEPSIRFNGFCFDQYQFIRQNQLSLSNTEEPSASNLQWYNLKEPNGINLEEINIEEMNLQEEREQMEKEDINQVDKMYDQCQDKCQDQCQEYQKEKGEPYFSLGIPLELPTENNQEKIYVDDTGLDLPNNMDQEDKSIESVDSTNIEKNVKLQSLVKYYGSL